MVTIDPPFERYCLGYVINHHKRPNYEQTYRTSQICWWSFVKDYCVVTHSGTKTIFSLILQAILEQELRPYFDGKWKGLGDPHLSSYGIDTWSTFDFVVLGDVANAKFKTLCQMARLALFSVSPRLFDFLYCKTEIKTLRWLHEKIEAARCTELLKNKTARPT